MLIVVLCDSGSWRLFWRCWSEVGEARRWSSSWGTSRAHWSINQDMLGGLPSPLVLCSWNFIISFWTVSIDFWQFSVFVILWFACCQLKEKIILKVVRVIRDSFKIPSLQLFYFSLIADFGCIVFGGQTV